MSTIMVACDKAGDSVLSESINQAPAVFTPFR